jgi:hypothetical protein
MKKYTFAILATLALLALQVSQATLAAGQSTASRDFKKTVEFEAGGDFTLNTDKGSVRLTSWDNNRIEISARIEADKNVDDDYGRRSVEATRIDVTGNTRSLTVRSNFDDVPYKDGFANHSRTIPHIHYEIRAPRNLNLHVNVDRSNLTIEGFKGKARIDADRTPLKASDLDGDLHIQVDRGELKLANVRGRFDINADRTNGYFQGMQIEGDSRLEIDRGEFELRMPDSQALTINANMSRRESFDSDFGVTMKTSGRHSFEGAINGGGPKLSIEADRGRVSLKRQ